jgi:hypothetical protein
MNTMVSTRFESQAWGSLINYRWRFGTCKLYGNNLTQTAKALPVSCYPKYAQSTRKRFLNAFPTPPPNCSPPSSGHSWTLSSVSVVIPLPVLFHSMLLRVSVARPPSPYVALLSVNVDPCSISLVSRRNSHRDGVSKCKDAPKKDAANSPPPGPRMNPLK